jgi:hypothetical protein
MAECQSVSELCRLQAEWCERLGSPLYAYLLRRAAEDYEQGGPVRELLEPYANDSRGSALPLRMMGAVHRLALQGELPELAQFYPSCGGTVELEPAWRVFRHVLCARMDALRKLVLNPVQTNEVGRCGPLLGGFLLIAQRTGLPLRLLEIGASAGLNLNWDHYRYTWPGGAWGDSSSPVMLRDVFRGDRLPPLCDIVVSGRAGCDPDPVDATSAEGRLTLRSFIWADQLERMHTLDQAIEVMRRYPVSVDRDRAVDWLASRLTEPAPGKATVLFHSVVWQYISRKERKELLELIEETGRRASHSSPFAWLRMEPGKEGAEVKLRITPGFEDRVIATAGYHKPQTTWLLENE